MGLADLKKNSTASEHYLNRCQNQNVEIDNLIDDFINDANRYAMGQQSIATSINLATVGKAQAQASAYIDELKDEQRSQNAAKKIKPKKCVNSKFIKTKNKVAYRKATFTLSETAISHLSELSKLGDIAKSKLIRLLIEKHFNQTTAQIESNNSSN